MDRSGGDRLRDTGASPVVAADSSRDVATLLQLGPDVSAKIRILVVDDEHTLRESCAAVLRAEGYDVTICGRGQDALDLMRRRPFNIVVADLYMPQVDGFALLRGALEASPTCLVIVMTGNPSLESSIQALREGAWNYLPKPFSAQHLQILVGRAVHTLLVAREGEEQQARPAGPGGGRQRTALLGNSPMFLQAVELAKRVAPSDASVFITGESGSGKELVAQYIHQHSRRASRPFIAVNCAAIPETLLESEMFGHRKGAFTGAVRDKPGLLETANGGTLFLDELGEMSTTIQAKLLRVIQDGVVRRVGSETTDAVVNVRFICATNRNVDAAVKAGELREDLYYRLCVVPIHLPALRERREDIPILADYFLGTFWAKHRSPGARRPEFTDAALRALAAYSWRGNVRELQNAIEHAAVLAEPGARLQPADLPLRDGAPETTTTGVPDAPADSNPASLIATLLGESYHTARDRVIAQFETQYLTWLVNRAGGNMSQAARVAGVDRTTLYRLMERHGLHRNPRAGWVVESAPETTPPTLPPTDPAMVTSAETPLPLAPVGSDRGSAA